VISLEWKVERLLERLHPLYYKAHRRTRIFMSWYRFMAINWLQK